MGSGAETCQATVDRMVADGEKVGMLTIRLYRPFAMQQFIEALPKTVKVIIGLGSYQRAGLRGRARVSGRRSTRSSRSARSGLGRCPLVVGGRYGLSSKEFTPGMVQAVFKNAAQAKPKNHFTIGINDDVTHTSLAFDPDYNIEDPDGVCAIFYGLGSDGTVGANKSTIKIIGENTPNYAQGYFVYDSKKVRVHDRVASAFRAASDSRDLSDFACQFCGLPSGRLLGEIRCLGEDRGQRGLSLK